MKSTISLADNQLIPTIVSTLAGIHKELLAAAKQRLTVGTYPVSSYAEMKAMITDASGNDNQRH